MPYTTYEPYNFSSFEQLIRYGYTLGWYGGRKKLFVLTLEGEFEGFSGRASETWEQRFTLESDLIETDNYIIPAIHISGKSVEEVCSQALKIINNVLENNKK